MTLLFGLETEYGLAGPTDADACRAGLPATDHTIASCDLVDAALGMMPSLPDQSPCGGFLANGSRVYVDGHPELSTPEVSTPADLVRYTLAGERILERALARRWGAGNGSRPILFKSNVDYLSRRSWGCHESILCDARTLARPHLLIPHLVSRVVFAGAGGFDPFCPGISFVLSARALFLATSVSGSSTDGRGIVHRKDEPLGTGPHKRLHIICGESLCSQQAMWLKAASTVLVVKLVDEGLDPGEVARPADPTAALHAIVRDPSCRTEVLLADGRRASAIAVQRSYLDAVEARMGAAWMPEWGRTACEQWRAILDELERAPESVAATLDWAIKRALFGRVLARHGFDWPLAERWTKALAEVMQGFGPAESGAASPNPERLLDPGMNDLPSAPRIEAILDARGLRRDGLASFLRARRALFECDIRFGELGGRGLFEALDRDGVLTHHAPGVDDVERAVEHPPAQGRAHVRGEAIRRLAGDGRRLVCDWTSIAGRASDQVLDLGDPFVQEEIWRPASEFDQRAQSADQTRGAAALCWTPYNLRSQALSEFLAGRFDAAERALVALLETGVETQSTHCHLARVFLAQGHNERAREHAALAWDAREGAPRYVMARTLWLHSALAVLDGGDWQPWVGRLKALPVERKQMQEWSMEPVVEWLRWRLPFSEFEMLTALLRVVGRQVEPSELERYDWWRAA